MKATQTWSSARPKSLAQEAIFLAKAGEIETTPTKPAVSGLPVSKAAPDGGVSAPTQTCNSCKESGPLAITGRMAQAVSHDLRNHLSVIYSNVEFMATSAATDPERETLMEAVRAAVRDMTDMLDALLLFSKTGQPLHPRRESLNEIVENAIRMVRAHPDARNVNFAVRNAASVGGWIDPAKLSSAVYNLLLNACQAAKLSMAARIVEVSITEDQSFVHIRVRDSGPGVPDSVRETLFQPFVRTEKVSGLGLGLAIVDCVVREHGGYVNLEESRPGRTVFGLHLSKRALETLALRQQLTT